MSNLLLGYKKDLRESSAALLLGLGIPVSISPDDPGKFGCDDTTEDYFVSAVCCNWTLRHLKLIAYHSINHALCDEKIREKLIKMFEQAWNQWIANFLKISCEGEMFKNNFINKSDVFDSELHWSFSPEEEIAEKKLTVEKEKIIGTISEDMYHLRSGKYSTLMKDIENS